MTSLIGKSNIMFATVNGAAILGGKVDIKTYREAYERPESTVVLYPRKLYILTYQGDEDLVVQIDGNDSYSNEYMFQVDCTSVSISPLIESFMPLCWANGDMPTYEVGYIYRVTIIGKTASYMRFKTV